MRDSKWFRKWKGGIWFKLECADYTRPVAYSWFKASEFTEAQYRAYKLEMGASLYRIVETEIY